MSAWRAFIAVALLASGAIAAAIDAPPPLALPMIVAAVIVAPAVAVAGYVPGRRRLDVSAVAATFGVALVVVVSGILAIVSMWSGPTVLAVVGAITIALVLGLVRSSTGPPPQDDRVELRVLWFDGRVCCRLVLNRFSGEIDDVEVGHYPAMAPCIGEPPRQSTGSIERSVAHGEHVVNAIARRNPGYRRKGVLTIDLERRPWLCHADGELYLWLGADIDDRSLDDHPIDRWVVGGTPTMAVGLGLDRARQPVVIRVRLRDESDRDGRAPRALARRSS